VRGDAADEAAGERVARARRIGHEVDGEGRHPERVVGRDERGAVLAELDDHRRRAVLHDLARAGDDLALTGEELDLGVVENHAVDLGDRVDERLAGDVDPQVHRVQGDPRRRLALPTDVELQDREDVGEKQDVALPRGPRQLRIERLEDVEVGLERLARVHVLAVDAAPEERLAALDVLDVLGVDVAAVQDGVLVGAEVVADRADDANLVEERGGEREMDGSAAEHALAPAVRGLHGVIGNRSDNGDTHCPDPRPYGRCSTVRK